MSKKQHPKDFVFTPEFEEAFVGHLVTDPKVFEVATLMDFKSGNVVEPSLIRIIDEVYSFQAKHKRHPSIAELKVGNLAREDKKVVEHTWKVLDRAISRTQDIGVDALLADLSQWKMALTIKGSYEDEIQAAYLRGDLDQVLDAMEDTVTKCRRIGQRGLIAGVGDMETWLNKERADREKQGGQTIKLGIQYLDDAMDGVGANELVVLTSKTGLGKSQMCTRVATTAAEAGIKTFLMALEAAPGEMQRRIKFPILMGLYRNARGPKAPPIDYVKFVHGHYRNELAEFEDIASRHIVMKYGNITTLYRSEAGYGIKEMVRDVSIASRKHGLVVLDHIHYVDLDESKNENQQLKKIMDELALAVTLGTPIVAAAHLRKEQEHGKYVPLIPTLESVSGGHITKIATSVVILGETDTADPTQIDVKLLQEKAHVDGRPTLVHLAKFRNGGTDRTRYAALCFYRPSKGTYAKEYILGRLSNRNTKFTPVYSEDLPDWATCAIRMAAPSNEA